MADLLPSELWQRILAQEPSNVTRLAQIPQFQTITRDYSDHVNTVMEQEHRKLSYIGIFTNSSDPEIRAAAATAILAVSQDFYLDQIDQLFVLGLQLNRLDFLEPFFTNRSQVALETQLKTFWLAMEDHPDLAEQLLEVDWLPWPFTELIQPDYGQLKGLIDLKLTSSASEVMAAVTACGNHIGTVRDYQQSAIIRLLNYAMLLDLPQAMVALKRTYVDSHRGITMTTGLVTWPSKPNFERDHLAKASQTDDLDLVVALTAYGYINTVQQAWSLVRQKLSLKTYYPVFYATATAAQWSPLLASLARPDKAGSAKAETANDLKTILDDLAYLLANSDRTLTAYSDWSVALAQELVSRGYNIKLAGTGTTPGPKTQQFNLLDWPSLDITGHLAMWLLQQQQLSLTDVCLNLNNLVNPQRVFRSYQVDPLTLLKGYYLDGQLVDQILTWAADPAGNPAGNQVADRQPLDWWLFLDHSIFLWSSSDNDNSGQVSLSQAWARFETLRPPGTVPHYLNWWLAATTAGDWDLVAQLVEHSRLLNREYHVAEYLGLAYWSRLLWARSGNLLTKLPREILSTEAKLHFTAIYSLPELRLDLD